MFIFISFDAYSYICMHCQLPPFSFHSFWANVASSFGFFLSQIHIHLSSMLFWYNFSLFFRSLPFALWHFGVRTVINTHEGISSQKGEPNEINQNHSKPLKWIDHWLLYWIYFASNVFNQKFVDVARFVSALRNYHDHRNLLTLLFAFNQVRTPIIGIMMNSIIATDKRFLNSTGKWNANWKLKLLTNSWFPQIHRHRAFLWYCANGKME